MARMPELTATVRVRVQFIPAPWRLRIFAFIARLLRIEAEPVATLEWEETDGRP
jgi:hypothetical protein